MPHLGNRRFSPTFQFLIIKHCVLYNICNGMCVFAKLIGVARGLEYPNGRGHRCHASALGWRLQPRVHWMGARRGGSGFGGGSFGVDLACRRLLLLGKYNRKAAKHMGVWIIGIYVYFFACQYRRGDRFFWSFFVFPHRSTNVFEQRWPKWIHS